MCCVLPDTVNTVKSRNKRKGGRNAGTASLRTLPIFPKPKRAWFEPNRRSECPEAKNLHELSNIESCLWVHVSAFGTEALGQ